MKINAKDADPEMWGLPIPGSVVMSAVLPTKSAHPDRISAMAASNIISLNLCMLYLLAF